MIFQSKPPSPPSSAEKQLEETRKLNLKESTKYLFKNNSYVVLLIVSGLGLGVFYAVPTLLSQIIAVYFENAQEDAGRIGLLLLIIGMLGVPICGYVLDKYERYKLTTILVFAFYFLGMVAFTVSLYYSIVAVYASAIILGFFMTASYSVSLDVAAQLTFPIPETTSSGYVLIAGQFFGIGQTYLYSHILYKYGALYANILTSIELLLCTLLLMCMKFENKRNSVKG